jgi:HEPN domain-containing protein
VEKALKSFLLAHDQPLERTHSLPRLLSLCEPYASELTRFEDSITELDVYYAPTRYADVGQAIDYTESRIERALAGAEEVLDVLASRIEARLHDSEMKSDD